MLSSTFFDLEEKRQQVLDLMARHEFHDIAWSVTRRFRHSTKSHRRCAR
jgi:hypothetical protein